MSNKQLKEENKSLSFTMMSFLNQIILLFKNLMNMNITISYMPIVLSNEHILNIIKELNKNNIFPRRYFYPSLNTIDTIQELTKVPTAEILSKNIICLPSYTGLEDDDIKRISSIIKDNI